MFLIHVFACTWLYFGTVTENGWMDANYVKIRNKTVFTKYICAFYWVTTTLTTVGYGDFKGNQTNEYVYTMLVEFFGFIVFGFIMSSINNVLQKDTGGNYEVLQTIERVDLWLVTLDKLKSSKPIPRVLYEDIKKYITVQTLYDQDRIVRGYDFLYQLKPRLRFKLVCELFDRFRRDFNHLFTFQSTDVGNEFISFFITSCYSRLYVPGQTIVHRGENFSELNMICKGKVIVSLRKKYEHEFFILYSTNYFGDYQIIEDHKATETYCAVTDQEVMLHCVKAR